MGDLLYQCNGLYLYKLMNYATLYLKFVLEDICCIWCCIWYELQARTSGGNHSHFDKSRMILHPQHYAPCFYLFPFSTRPFFWFLICIGFLSLNIMRGFLVLRKDWISQPQHYARLLFTSIILPFSTRPGF